MPLFTKESFSKMIEALLLNAHAVIPAGYANGKVGISLILFELTKFTKNEYLEEHAYNLLKEVLSYDITDTSFKHGKAGIAFTIDYLINNELLDADYNELYQIEHQFILEDIKQIEYNPKNYLKHTDYFFFVNALSNHFTKEELNHYNGILSQYINSFLNENFNVLEIGAYYSFVSRLFSICNSISCIPQSIKQSFIQRIQENEEKFKKQDFICTNPLYPLKKTIYSELNSSQFPQHNNPVTDIIVEYLNVKEKIDLIYDIYRLYSLNKKYDYRDFAKKVLISLTNDDVNKQEQILLNTIFSKDESTFGIEMGLSRILLLHINWESINKGTFQEKTNRLFI